MIATELANVLKTNKAVNDKGETYISFVSHARPDHWNFVLEAHALLPFLEALEQAGVIKILK